VSYDSSQRIALIFRKIAARASTKVEQRRAIAHPLQTLAKSTSSEPGNLFEAIPKDWVCPVCGAAKSRFEPLEEIKVGFKSNFA
jgi:rubrerythrin